MERDSFLLSQVEVPEAVIQFPVFRHDSVNTSTDLVSKIPHIVFLFKGKPHIIQQDTAEQRSAVGNAPYHQDPIRNTRVEVHLNSEWMSLPKGLCTLVVDY